MLWSFSWHAPKQFLEESPAHFYHEQDVQYRVDSTNCVLGPGQQLRQVFGYLRGLFKPLDSQVQDDGRGEDDRKQQRTNYHMDDEFPGRLSPAVVSIGLRCHANDFLTAAVNLHFRIPEPRENTKRSGVVIGDLLDCSQPQKAKVRERRRSSR